MPHTCMSVETQRSSCIKTVCVEDTKATGGGDLHVSRVAIYKLLRKHENTRALELGDKHYQAIDDTLAENDELKSRDLIGILEECWPDIELSISTVKCAWRALGWLATRPKYCQIIREDSRQK